MAEIISEAVIHIEEDEQGDIKVYVELDPEISPEQREGKVDLSWPQYTAGLLLNALEQIFVKMGMEGKSPVVETKTEDMV